MKQSIFKSKNPLRKLTLLALCILLVDTVWASPKYRLASIDKSEVVQRAKQFLALSELPDKKTRVLYDVAYELGKELVTKRVRVVRFFPKSTDIESNGNATIYWDHEIETLTFQQAGVVNPDGTFQRIDQDNVRVITSNDYNTFTNMKEVIVPFSGLREGGLSVLEYQIQFRLSQLETKWSDSIFPVTLEDTQSFNLSVNSADLRLFTSVQGDRFDCKTEPHKVNCTGRNLIGYKSDSGVVWRDHIDQIHLSAFSKWSEVIEQSLHAFEKSELDAPEVDALFDRLTNGLATVEEKLAAIHEYVARDIRYVSLSELGHRITPHRVALLDKNRFGDCKDKTAALVALIRRLGLFTYPVLVATERQDPQRLQTPTSGYFDHMIACFDYESETFCIDGTDTNVNWRATPSWIQGAVSLPLKPEAQPERLPFKEPRWVLTSHSKLVFTANGGQQEWQERTFFGSYAGDLRGTYRGKTNEERVATAKKQYSDWVSTMAEPEIEFTNVDPMSMNLAIKSTADFDTFLETKEDLNVTERDVWIRYELLESRLKTEFFDTEFAGLHMKSTIEADVSSLWKLTRLPAKLKFSGRFGKLTRSVKHKQDQVAIIETEVLIPTQTVPQADIVAFNDYLTLLANESSIVLQGALKQVQENK